MKKKWKLTLLSVLFPLIMAITYVRLQTEITGLNNLTDLKQLRCANNRLKELPGLGSLTSLTTLFCYGNQLTELTGLGSLEELSRLDCSNNQLAELDASALKNLTLLNCANNPLSSLKLVRENQLTIGSAAGGRAMLTDTAYTKGKSAELTANPDEGYIFQTWQVTGTLLADAAANPVTLPLDSVINITPVFETEDANNDAYHEGDVAAVNAMITENGLYAGPNDPAGWADSLSIVTWNNENPKRMTGLFLGSKDLTGTLDVSALTRLTDLECHRNQLTEITGLDSLTGLIRLNCHSNQLTALNGLSRLTSLTDLFCASNYLTVLDISPLISLSNFNCGDNPLVSLRLAKDMLLTVDSAVGGTVMVTEYYHLPFNNDILLTATPNANYLFKEWQTSNAQIKLPAVNTGRFTVDDTMGNLTITPVFETKMGVFHTYTVQAGDSLWAISRRCSITLLELMDANPLIKDPDFILAGWELNIP